ncbi:MAG: cupin domain-containing protein [Myxococcaceae bacterium]
MKISRSNETAWTEAMNQGAFSQRRKPLGGDKVKCSLWELPPGKKSFPLHAHHGTEEALFVVSGRAKVRTPEGETQIGPADFVSFPAGGVAHQLINDSKEPFVYMAMSVSVGLDIVEYPDSKKVACSVGVWPNVKRFVFSEASQVAYFDGEKDAG